MAATAARLTQQKVEVVADILVHLSSVVAGKVREVPLAAVLAKAVDRI